MLSFDVAGSTIHQEQRDPSQQVVTPILYQKGFVRLEISECPLKIVPGNVCQRPTIIFQTIYIYQFTISDFR